MGAESVPTDFNNIFPIIKINFLVQIVLPLLQGIIGEDGFSHVVLNHVLQVKPLLVKGEFE